MDRGGHVHCYSGCVKGSWYPACFSVFKLSAWCSLSKPYLRPWAVKRQGRMSLQSRSRIPGSPWQQDAYASWIPCNTLFFAKLSCQPRAKSPGQDGIGLPRLVWQEASSPQQQDPRQP